MAFDFRQSRAFRGPISRDIITNREGYVPRGTADKIYPGHICDPMHTWDSVVRFAGLDPFGRPVYCRVGSSVLTWDRERRYLAVEWARIAREDQGTEAPDPYKDSKAQVMARSIGGCISEISCTILRDVNGVRVASRWCEGLPEWYDVGIVDEYDPKWEGGSFVTVYACEMYGPRTTPPQWIRIAAHQVSHELPCPHCGDGSDHYKGRTEDCELCEGIGYLSGEYDSHVTYWVPDGMMSSDD